MGVRAFNFFANEASLANQKQNFSNTQYEYNEIDEIKRENKPIISKFILYRYDVGGNLTQKTEYPYTTGTLGTPLKTINYNYGDSNWKDKLTSYDGKDVTYDQIGNPLTYDGYTYTWEQGRQLKAISGNGKNLEFKYNDAGIRTEKKYNGVVTKYHLVGDKVTYEDNGSDKIYYAYDSSSHLVSMNLNGVEYYYIRNAQGDIIGLYDKNGTQVVSYTYDTWGKLISIDGSLKDSVGVKNPYRYRGYRYDTETGLYYLQSRYYNPEWGRFIDADGVVGQLGELLGHNVFAYCCNNPISREDSDGFTWRDACESGGATGGTTYSSQSAVSSGSATKVVVEAEKTLIIQKPKPYSNPKVRPKYGKNQVEKVWNSAKDIDGRVYDPNTGEELFWNRTKSRVGQWDMGHTPENKYSNWHKKYMDGEITKEEFLKWYRNPNNYRPESPSPNRGHLYE